MFLFLYLYLLNMLVIVQESMLRLPRINQSKKSQRRSVVSVLFVLDRTMLTLNTTSSLSKRIIPTIFPAIFSMIFELSVSPKIVCTKFFNSSNIRQKPPDKFVLICWGLQILIVESLIVKLTITISGILWTRYLFIIFHHSMLNIV